MNWSDVILKKVQIREAIDAFRESLGETLDIGAACNSMAAVFPEELQGQVRRLCLDTSMTEILATLLERAAKKNNSVKWGDEEPGDLPEDIDI